MLRRLRPRLTYANVVATLALVIAVGTGGAYAASKIGAADLKRITERTGPTVELAEGESRDVSAQCRKNERVVGGGYSLLSGGVTSGADIRGVRRAGPRRFAVRARRAVGSPRESLVVRAYCLRR